LVVVGLIREERIEIPTFYLAPRFEKRVVRYVIVPLLFQFVLQIKHFLVEVVFVNYQARCE
jgi:hypothetical protein